MSRKVSRFPISGVNINTDMYTVIMKVIEGHSTLINYVYTGLA